MATELTTPYIPLGSDAEKGLEVMKSYNLDIDITPEEDGVTSYYMGCDEYEYTMYVTENKLVAVWYNDPLGRESEEGVERKLELYMERFGLKENWELTLNNGWMRYYFNDKESKQIVYGIHQDVIRVNLMS